MPLHTMSMRDTALAALLLAIIIALVVWVQSDTSGDNGMSEEGFVNRTLRKRRAARSAAGMLEHFAASSGPSKAGGPRKLTSASQLEVGDDEVALVFIHHTQCGHCIDFKPMWKRLCAKYQGARPSNGKRLALYDIDNESNEGLWNATSKKYSVAGYPTVMVVTAQGATEYTGPRNEFAMWCSHLEEASAA